MKKYLLFVAIGMLCVVSNALAQSNVFDPNDPVHTYDPAHPPATPPANAVSKWVRTVRMTWNTDKFKPYILNNMAFRLRYPNNYNPADTTKKYPIILFLHGGGEVEFPVDNELQLLQGAQFFEQKIDSGAFNGFMVFPQIQFYDTWSYPNYLKVNDMMDSIQRYCQMDPDRVLVMGLSNGGYGAVSYSADFPQRSAVAIASSPALIQLVQDRQNALIHIPLWLASGGEDVNPDTATMRIFTDAFREKGGDVRYNMFQAVGHGTWDPQWALPYLVPYWNTSHKANPLIFHQINKFATAAAINAKLGISAGFAQYQWQKDGIEIPGATSNEYSPTQFGVYRVRFKRSATSNWSVWSPVPASIIQDNSAPSAPGNLKAVYNGRGFIHLDWDNSTDNQEVTGYEIFVNGVKKYTTGESALTANELSFNTSYTFTIRAFDMAGNTSAMSGPLVASTSSVPGKGLAYRLYQGSWESLPNFNALTPVKVGSSPNVDITQRPSDVNDFFGFVWEGYINIPAAGDYTFETNSDEGSKLYFNSFYSPTAKALINNDDIHYALTRTKTINIPAAGLYPIAMTYFERHSAESMQVYWSGPGITRSLIPDSAFIEGPSNNIPAPNIPANLKVLYSSKTYVNLDWDNSTGSIPAKTYDIYVNGVKKYTTNESAITADGLSPNTPYTFTIKAVDSVSNASAASAPVTGITTETSSGLKYRYYEGNWDSLPNFNALTPVKKGSTPNIDIVTPRTAGVSNYFGFVWEGYIYIKTAGSYTFETNSDNGSKLYFNKFYSPSATPLINNDGAHPATSVSATVDLTPGLYPIAMTFFEKDGGENMDVYWSGPGFTRQLIPDIAFTDPSADNVAPSVPLNVRALYTGKTYVNLDWDNSTDNLAVTGYDVYVNGVKKYTTVESAITADSLSSNTSYTFTVKAIDLASNSSAASAPVTAATTVTTSGLKYRYYEGDWDLLPNFNALTPVKTGSTPNVDIVTPRTAGVNNYFAFVWEGYINIKTAGTYTFETNSDNGSKLYFNKFYSPSATSLVNNDGAHPATSVSATIDLTPGLYPIAMTFFEKDGGENMDVYWSGPGFTRQAIPDVAFTDPSSDVVPPTVPLNVKALYTGKTYVNLDWDNSTDNLAVTGYDIYVNGVKKYTTTESAITADGLTANTSYTFTIKAVDLASNNSAASAPVTAATTVTTSGLKYRYYEGDWDLLPNFNALTPVKTGSTPNVDIVTPRTAGVNNYFAFVWEGYINIKTAGTYTFETNSDNGSKLYFNKFYSPSATPLVNNDGAHPATSVSATIDLTPGLYPIAMTFFEKDGGENMDVYWSGPGFTRQAIPDVAFTDPSSDVVPPTVPLNVKALYTGKTHVNLDWDNSTDNLVVTGYDIYVNGVKKYTTAESAITADGLTPNTAYTFTVKAVDLASNNSAESAPVTATTTVTPNGLNYRYYEGDWDLLPNFNALTPVKTGSTPNVDIVTPRTAGVNNYFAFVWEGYINIKTAGTYTFETNSDNGSKLYFNKFYSPSATPLVNNDGAHPATSVSATIDLTPGLYPIAMTFFEKDGGENMDVYWTGPGFTRQAIPDVAFTDPSSDKIAPTAPLNLKALYSGKTFVHLDWDNSTDNVGVTAYDIYVNNVKKYTTSESAVTADLLTAGTTYNFTVIARDVAGNGSDASTPVAASTTATANGLKYRYYEGTWDALPNFNALTPVSSGSSANVNIGVRPPGVNNSFGFVWEGHINIQTAGTYTFETISDDGSKLYVNSFYSPTAIPLVTNDGTHPATSVSANIDITTTGLHPIAITFFEKDGGESMQVFITGPGIPRQLIPDMAFRENGVVPAAIGQQPSGLTSGLLTAEVNSGTITLKSIQAYPNPISDWINIAFYNESQTTNLRANVYDMNGKLVYNQYYGSMPAGNNTLRMNIKGSKLAPGVYFVRLDINGVPSKTIKLIKPIK